LVKSKVLFVDVGQGSCQVILLGNNRAIVIDAGCSPELPLRLLTLYQIKYIELLVISHSHFDHSGGIVSKGRKAIADAVVGVLVAYQTAIGKVAYVFDDGFLSRPVGKFLLHLLNTGVLKPEQATEIAVAEKPYELWSSSEHDIVVAAISPHGGHRLTAFASGNPNASSAILELRHKGERIVFAADSEYDQWRSVRRLRETTMKCKVLTLPHHGGLMAGTTDDLKWFAKEAVEPQFVIVSVATRNQHKHPRPEVIQAFASGASHIFCTQITGQCCANLEFVRPGVIGSLNYPCRSSPKRILGSKLRSAHVACAGTIAALLDEDGIKIERHEEHRNGIDKLVATGATPMCRPLKGGPNTIHKGP
jgi:competence protein ComEC